MAEILIDYARLFENERVIQHQIELIEKLEKQMDELAKAGQRLSGSLSFDQTTGREYADLTKKIAELERVIESYQQAQTQATQANTAATNAMREQQRAIEALDRQRQRALQQAFRDEQRAEQAAREHAEALNSQGNSLEELRRRYAALNRERNKANIGSAEFRDLTEQIRRTGNQLQDFDRQVNRHQSNVGNYAGAIKNFALEFVGLGAAVYGIISAFSEATKTIAENSKVNARISALTKGTTEELSRLKDAQVSLASEYGKSVNEIANSQAELAAAGLNANQIMEAQPVAMKLSIAAGEDLTKTTETLISTIFGLGLSMSDSEKVANVMSKAMNDTQLKLEDLSYSFKYVTPIAQATKTPIEQVAAMIEVLGQAGIKGEIAGTGLRAMFQDLLKTGKPLKESLKDIALEMQQATTDSEKLAIAGNYVRDTATTQLLALTQNIEGLEKFEKANYNAKNEVNNMANAMGDNLQMTIDKSKAAYEGFVVGLDNSSGIISTVTKAWYGLKTAIFETLGELNKYGSFSDLFNPSGVTKNLVSSKIRGGTDKLKQDFMKGDYTNINKTKATLVEMGIAYEDASKLVNKWTIERAKLHAQDKKNAEESKKAQDEKNKSILKEAEIESKITNKEVSKADLVALKKEQKQMAIGSEEYLATQKKIDEIEELIGNKRQARTKKEIDLEQLRIATLQGFAKEMAQAIYDNEKKIEEIKEASWDSEKERMLAIEYATEAHNQKINEITRKYTIENESIKSTLRTKPATQVTGTQSTPTQKLQNIPVLSGSNATKPQESKETKFTGVSDFFNEYGDVITAVQDAYNQIIDADVEYTTIRLENQQAIVQGLEQELAAEEEKAARGEKNRAKEVANQLKLEQAKQAQLKKEQDKALENKKKAAKIDMAISIATQTANVFESVTNVIKGWSKIPFVGVILAAAQVAVLFAMLARYRNVSKQKPETFGEGGEIHGNSHKEGGKIIEAEGGEFVVRKSAYSKSKQLTNAINNGELTDRNISTYLAMRLINKQTTSSEDGTALLMLAEMKQTNRILRKDESKLTLPKGSVMERKNGCITIINK